ncbi:unnamed protein product, partial [Medioppia subpectinata]
MKYWTFSMDEFTKYDITSAIEHVIRVTNSETIGYIGYSLGTTMMYQLLSSKPNYSNIIKPFISLGPFVYISHILSPLLRIPMSLEPILSSNPKPLARLGSLSPLIGRYFCGFAMFKEICVIFGFLFGGFDYPQLNRTQTPRLFAHFPDSSSTIAVSHVIQRIMNENFSYFSYNSSEMNQRVYGQQTAPNYNISSIDSKYIVIMNGLNDWIADPTDVDILVDQLTVPIVRHVIPYEHWTHGDFVFAREVGKYINAPILGVLHSLGFGRMLRVWLNLSTDSFASLCDGLFGRKFSADCTAFLTGGFGRSETFLNTFGPSGSGRSLLTRYLCQNKSN